jgi:ribosome-associated protein
LDIKKLQEVIVEALDDIKGRDIVVFDTIKGSAEFDRVIIATADVARQTKALAMNVIDKVKAAGGRIVSMEGGASGEWILVDCGDAIVHIMQPAARQHYNLEELWGQKQVKVLTAAERAAEVARKLAEKAKAAKKAVAKKPLSKKPSVKKPATKQPATKKPVPKKSVDKKAVAKKPVKKASSVKKTAVKKAAARQVVAKAPTAPTAKRAVTRGSVAKKASASKAAKTAAGKTASRAKVQRTAKK